MKLCPYCQATMYIGRKQFVNGDYIEVCADTIKCRARRIEIGLGGSVVHKLAAGIATWFET